MPAISTKTTLEAEQVAFISFPKTCNIPPTTVQYSMSPKLFAQSCLLPLYINAQKAVEMRTIRQEMGHPQPPTPMQTDNSTAEGIINSKVQPKRTKAMEMRFHWLQDRGVNKKQFRFYWRPGPLNYADKGRVLDNVCQT
jgi:hypothetical protein